MAKTCMATGLQPSEYWALTLRERSAFIQAHNDIHGKG